MGNLKKKKILIDTENRLAVVRGEKWGLGVIGVKVVEGIHSQLSNKRVMGM